jgi:hypothetical protein
MYLQTLYYQSGYRERDYSRNACYRRHFDLSAHCRVVNLLPLSIKLCPADIKWLTANYGRLYQVTIRFNYIEKDLNNIITYKSFDWDLGTIRTTSLQAGNLRLAQPIWGSQFYMSVRSHIQPNPNVKRYAGKVNLIITVAGDDLATYIDVNKPSGGIIQEKPEYTNVTNGIGSFSSRLDKRFSYFLSLLSPKIHSYRVSTLRIWALTKATPARHSLPFCQIHSTSCCLRHEMLTVF